MSKTDLAAIRWCYRQAKEMRGAYTGSPAIAEYDAQLAKAKKAISQLSKSK